MEKVTYVHPHTGEILVVSSEDSAALISAMGKGFQQVKEEVTENGS